MIGIIGGTGVYEIVELGRSVKTKKIETPYGPSPEISLFRLNGKDVVFIPRHAMGHSKPPHMINYLANIWSLKKLGVERVIATNAVGSLDKSVRPGNFVIPNDFLDFTKMRKNTFYNDKTVHVDVTKPYCPQLRNILKTSENVIVNGVYICTEGPRFETAAEIQMFRRLGGTVVGMTGLPEVVLARELEMCYLSICTVSNFAASISPDKLTIDEVFEIVDNKREELINLISDVISKIPQNKCGCMNALDGAEVENVLKPEGL